MNPATYAQVDFALSKNLGHDRVMRTQKAAAEGPPDGVSGSLIIAIGCRETWGRNIEGGAKLENGVWVPETDGRKMDVGPFQISRRYHAAALRAMTGVKAGTWKPAVEGKTANSTGYCPRFADSLKFVIREFQANVPRVIAAGVPKAKAPFVATSGHNCGIETAIEAFLEHGDSDRWTTGGDYAEWAFACRTLINRWLGRHPNWKYVP